MFCFPPPSASVPTLVPEPTQLEKKPTHQPTANPTRPLACRQISLVCMTGVAGVIAYCGALIAYGVVRRSEGDFLGELLRSLLCLVFELWVHTYVHALGWISRNFLEWVRYAVYLLLPDFLRFISGKALSLPFLLLVLFSSYQVVYSYQYLSCTAGNG